MKHVTEVAIIFPPWQSSRRSFLKQDVILDHSLGEKKTVTFIKKVSLINKNELFALYNIETSLMERVANIVQDGLGYVNQTVSTNKRKHFV